MNLQSLLDSLTLSAGETKRMNCPVCGGQKTFTVTNNMGSLVWNCYKASCNVSGGKRVQLSASDIRNNLGSIARETEAVAFEKPEWIVKDNKAIAAYCKQWQLDENALGLLYDVKESRVVFPVMQGRVMVDATGRSLTHRLPKWKRYGKGSLPYSHGSGKTAVVVEDCVSAAIIGDDTYTGVAILGTSLSDAHKKYLSQYSTAVVALDPDALPKTLQFAKELRGYVNDVKVLRLNDDLKYRNPADLHNLSTLGD